MIADAKPSLSKTPVFVAGVSGLLFGIGLVLAGMTQPSKVVGFLDFGGDWDPSLAFVMGGAILVFAPAQWWIRRREKPALASTFSMPPKAHITKPLLIGSSLFGIGWGLSGFCPGPAIVSLGALLPEALLFGGGMVAGFVLFQWVGTRAGIETKKL